MSAVARDSALCESNRSARWCELKIDVDVSVWIVASPPSQHFIRAQ